jgi:hypothetical protein
MVLQAVRPASAIRRAAAMSFFDETKADMWVPFRCSGILAPMTETPVAPPARRGRNTVVSAMFPAADRTG